MTSCGVLEFRVGSNSKVQIFEPSELLKIKTHIKLIYKPPQQIGLENLKIFQNSNQHYYFQGMAKLQNFMCSLKIRILGKLYFLG